MYNFLILRLNQLSNSKVSNSIYVITTQIAKISGNDMLSAHPFQQQLYLPKNTVQGQLFSARLKGWTLFTSSLQQRWCSRDGVLERFELDDMDESDRCRNEYVDGVDGVVCRELDDALVTDL
jgi:hypothetical protein